MAIDKLFQVLVVGGVALGNQACGKKAPPEQAEPPASASEESTSSVVEEEETIGPKYNEEGVMIVNSKGEKCEDVCYGERSGEEICSEMCCWLMAVECCSNYSPPPE